MSIIIPDYEAIKSKALGILSEHGIEKPPVVAVGLARKQGFEVLCAMLDPVCVAGYIDVENMRIMVNSEDSPAQQNFTIAHELGHYALKHHERADYKENYYALLRNNCDDEETPMEQEANWFAENLLVPTAFLRDRLKKYPFLTNLQLANMFGVPVFIIQERMRCI